MTNSSRLASFLAVGGGLALAVAAPAPASANCGAYGGGFSTRSFSSFDTAPRPARRAKAKKEIVAAPAAATVAVVAPAAATGVEPAPCAANTAASCGASAADCGPRG